jgi:hypothetical protein
LEIEAGPLLLSLAISGVGFVFFSYGKKMARAPQILVGLLLMVYPYFVSELWVMAVVAAVLLGLLWLSLRLGW